MDAMSFILFGATGDLAKRKIYPALYNLFLDHKLASSFTVIGLGRKEIADPDFQASVKDSLKKFSRRPIDEATIEAFIGAFHYSSLNVNNVDDFRKLLAVLEKYEKELQIPENRLFYLSVSPEFFEIIAHNITESGLGNTQGWKRLIIEKPFGHDLASARSLHHNLSQSFEEDEIYRIDHYLGKPMVQNLEVLGFANPVLQALWNNRYIANVQITANELVGVEERAAYYDNSGAIRDMFQNHMMQLLMMVTMHLPHRSTPSEVRSKKKNIIQSLRKISKSDVASHLIRGQYAAGNVKGVEVPGYRSETGVNPDSQNDTYVAARLQIDTPFWSDIPFYIRTGKRTGEKSTRIVIEFKEPLKASSFPDEVISPNLLTIEVNPMESISLQLNVRDKNNGKQLEPVIMNFSSSSKETPEAYENLIHDALQGDSTFFAHWDEVELSWAWVQPVLDAFAESLVPLHFYEAGSDGPEAAHELLANDGFKWW